VRSERKPSKPFIKPTPIYYSATEYRIKGLLPKNFQEWSKMSGFEPKSGSKLQSIWKHQKKALPLQCF